MSVNAACRSVRLAWCAAVCLAGAAGGAPASAQQAAPPENGITRGQAAPPFRALFNGAKGRSVERGGLDLTVSLISAYDTNLAAAQAGEGGLADPRLKSNGAYSGADATLAWGREWSRVLVDASAASSFRYYPEFPEINSTAHRAQLGIGIAARRGTQLEVRTHASYSPFYSFRAFAVLPELPGIAPPVVDDLDFAVTRRDALSYGGTASISQDLGRRSTVSASYARRGSRLEGRVDRDRDEAAFAAEFSSEFARNGSLRVGYSRQRAMYMANADGRSADVDGVTIGIDYARRHSRTRSTGVGFSTGASRVLYSDTDRYRLTATASLNHEMGRTWRARVQYRRGVALLDGINEPLYADSVTATLNGLFSWRLEFDASAGIAEGEAGLTGDAPRYDALTASSQLRVGLRRDLALYTQYLFYDYRFRDGAVPSGVPRELTRHSVRVGLTWWFALLR